MAKKNQSVTARVRKTYPECYYIGGVGWCGPQWQEAAALEATLRERAVNARIFCHGCGESISAESAHWHNGDGYCDACEAIPAEAD